jgi:hypothetical protein
MLPLAERDIRRCFVNCSKGEAERVNLPVDLAGLPWADLDFLGWRDRGAPQLAYLVAERDGQLTGVTLRAPAAGKRSFTSRSMCSLCLTVRTASGVAGIPRSARSWTRPSRGMTRSPGCWRT